MDIECSHLRASRLSPLVLAVLCLLSKMGFPGESGVQGYLDDAIHLAKQLENVKSLIVEWSTEGLGKAETLRYTTNYRFMCDRSRYRLERVRLDASPKRNIFAKDLFVFDGNKAISLDNGHKTIVVRADDGEWQLGNVRNPLFFFMSPIENIGFLENDPDPKSRPRVGGLRSLADFNSHGFVDKVALFAKALKPWKDHPGWLTQDSSRSLNGGQQVLHRIFFVDGDIVHVAGGGLQTITELREKDGTLPYITATGQIHVKLATVKLPDGFEFPYARTIDWDLSIVPADDTQSLGSKLSVTKIKIDPPIDDEDFNVDISQAEHIYDSDKKAYVH